MLLIVDDIHNFSISIWSDIPEIIMYGANHSAKRELARII